MDTQITAEEDEETNGYRANRCENSTRCDQEKRTGQLGLASIRECNRLVLNIEKTSAQRFIRMEMGTPGLPPPQIAIDAEIEALKKNIGSIYPPFDGIPQLKSEISRFVKKIHQY